MRTVVQIALQPSSLLVGGLDDPGPRCGHCGKLRPHLDAEPSDLDRESRGAEHAVKQIGPLAQDRVVDEQPEARAAAGDLRSRAASRDRVDGATDGAHVGLALG